ncbi:helix-turn-helix domain-containing protein [Tenacibaculum mesophilum]|uniref:helix-turn-helix domain-containing protein n=1 Tax=Tenacibaculum mesophilum TaxID=104268 RepID=UPI002490A82F|nr:helix-turn-helix domain-containing protein [Tenacibaculum mesophilum]
MSNKVTQLHNLDPEEILNPIAELKKAIEELKKHLQPKEPTEFVTRNYVAKEMLHCNLTTVHNLTKRGILTKHGIGGRVLYKRAEVEEAVIRLSK